MEHMRFNLADNPVMRGLSKLFDVACLNILWLIFCMPVVTIGASTTAMYSVMMKLVKDEEGYILRGFLAAFKENFRQSTLIWLVMLLLSVLLAVDVWIVSGIGGMARSVFGILFFFAGFCLLGISVYVFPLLARYENTVRTTVKNAALLAVGRLPYTITMMAVIVVPIVVSFLNVRNLLLSLPIWLGVGGGAIAWVNSKILRHVFRIFDDRPDQERQESKEPKNR